MFEYWPYEILSCPQKDRPVGSSRRRVRVLAVPQVCARFNVHGPPETISTRKSLWLHALQIPKRIADILKIEGHSPFFEPRPLPAPSPKEVPVRDLSRFEGRRS